MPEDGTSARTRGSHCTADSCAGRGHRAVWSAGLTAHLWQSAWWRCVVRVRRRCAPASRIGMLAAFSGLDVSKMRLAASSSVYGAVATAMSAMSSRRYAWGAPRASRRAPGCPSRRPTPNGQGPGRTVRTCVLHAIVDDVGQTRTSVAGGPIELVTSHPEPHKITPADRRLGRHAGEGTDAVMRRCDMARITVCVSG